MRNSTNKSGYEVFYENRDVIIPFWIPTCFTSELLISLISAVQMSFMYRLITDVSQINMNETCDSARTSRIQSLWHSTEIICYNEEPWRIKGEKLIKKFHLKLITEIIKFTEINLIRFLACFPTPQSNIPQPSLILLHISL